jgi:hypothetical protein
VAYRVYGNIFSFTTHPGSPVDRGRRTARSMEQGARSMEQGEEDGGRKTVDGGLDLRLLLTGIRVRRSRPGRSLEVRLDDAWFVTFCSI